MSFSSQVNGFIEETEKDMMEFAQNKAKILFVKIVNRTPVDTGLLKGDWQVTFNKPSRAKVDKPDKTGTRVIAEIMRNLKTWDGKKDIFLSNNQPHVLPIEYGHSGQAPAGMVRVSLAEMGD